MRKTTKLLIFFVFILFCFNQILADDFDNTIKQGILYFNSGDFTRAVDFFKKAVLMKNDDLNARYNLAVTYFKLREYSKSLEETMDILKIFPTDEPTLKLLSQIRTQTVEELKIRIDEYPFEEKWYVDLANIYFLSREYGKSLQISNQGIANIPKAAKLYEIIAKIYQLEGDFNNALLNIEKAFHFAPDDPLIFENLKKIVEEKNRFSPVATGGQGSTTGGEVTDYADRYYIDANNAFANKNWNEAEELIRKALRISENNSVYRRKLEEILNARKKSQEASSLYVDGRKEYRLGRFTRAIDNIIKALEITPNEINYIEAYLWIVESYKALAVYDKMIEYCHKILELDGKNFQIHLYLADAYFLSGDFEKANEHFARINTEFSDYLAKYPSIKDNIDKRLMNIRLRKLGPLFRNILIGILSVVVLFILFLQAPFIKKNRNFSKACESFQKKSWNEVVDNLEPLLKFKYGHYKKIEIYKMLITSYIHIREFEKADHLIKEGLKLSGAGEDFVCFQATLSLKREEFRPDILYAYKILYQKDKNNIRLLKMITKYFWEKNRNPEFCPDIEIFENDKISILEKVFKYEKDNLEVINLLAEEYEKGEIYNRDVIKVFEKLLEFNFENIRVHLLLGKASLVIGEYEKAVKEAKFVFRRDINNVQAHEIFKKAFIAEGNIDQLLIEYENLLQIDPSNVFISDNIRELRKIRANYDAYIDKEEAEQNEDEMFSKAQKLFNEGQINDSITIFSELFEQNFKKQDTGFYLTYAYLKKDLLDLAYRQYRLSSFDEEILENRMKELIYQLGIKLENIGEFEKALEMYDKICRVDISYKDVFEKYENLALNMENSI